MKLFIATYIIIQCFHYHSMLWAQGLIPVHTWTGDAIGMWAVSGCPRSFKEIDPHNRARRTHHACSRTLPWRDCRRVLKLLDSPNGKWSLLSGTSVRREICLSGTVLTLTRSAEHPLQWRYNGIDGVSNNQSHICFCILSCLFGRRSNKTSKLRVTGLCAENSPTPG